MRAATTISLLAALGGAVAQEVYLGFNSGATTDSGATKTQDDFEKEFQAAQKLQHSPGLFNSIRLYTNIKPKTDNDPIEAFPAAVKTNTKLLLGMWCSGVGTIDNELTALEKAIEQYGKNFTDLVIGISVGSEDLYRVSESGIRNNAGKGQDAETIIAFIDSAREALKDTDLKDIPLGHIDTWTAWVNESNTDVIDRVDFVGANLFPYYEDDKGNDISNATTLFKDALNRTESAVGDKPVWITETGWPSTGPNFGQATATLENAQTYWNDVGCTLFGRRNTWYYILRDSNPDNEMKFALDPELDNKPIFNLTCPADSGAPASINNEESAAASITVSMMNTVALGLSMVFAMAAWIV
ncbi:glycoside hydrolase family 17 protein [Trematosphaeria pertusa]|uniref:Glycoside hydrolase family 17 protein n=1 Tax=Trematosphaeria pertusa TaxID=390896 RepID=A0A6A6HS09_9PLEO|nr:glycoside hydrolase family 17 protein [Trematosphaeria pertusa]KAF2240944.1 glycoside hydrolase family 17 protein [Trematosphaeria pertusa]